MSTIRQNCPSCNRMLELPTSAIGRLAQCPACESTFTFEPESHATDSIPAGESESVSASLERSSAPPANSAPPDAAPPANNAPADVAPPKSGPPTPTTPVTTNDSSSVDSPSVGPPPANPFSEPIRSTTLPTPTYEHNRMETARDPATEVDGIPISHQTVEEVFGATLSIFGARCGSLMLAFFLTSVVSCVALLVPAAVLSWIANAGRGGVASLGTVLGIPLAFVFCSFVSVGLARNAMAIARNSPLPLKELMPPMRIAMRFAVGAFLMGMVVAVVGGIFAAILAGLAEIGGNETLAGILGGLGALIVIVAVSAATWLLWSWLFAVSDGKTTALGAIRVAYSLTMHNKLTSALMIVVASVLSAIGASCYVGLLLTQPPTNLMFAIGYLLMTNQNIDRPRIAPQTEYAEPPTEPTF